MKNIKIQIIGESGSGKSLINSLILNMLLENGFDVKFNETLEEENFEKFERVRNNLLIDLEVVQANRNWKIEELNLEGSLEAHPLENILGQKKPVTIDEKDEWIDRGILESALNEENFEYIEIGEERIKKYN